MMLLTLLRERRMLRYGGVTSMEVDDSTTVADAVGQWRLAMAHRRLRAPNMNSPRPIASTKPSPRYMGKSFIGSANCSERRHSVPVSFG